MKPRHCGPGQKGTNVSVDAEYHRRPANEVRKGNAPEPRPPGLHKITPPQTEHTAPATQPAGGQGGKDPAPGRSSTTGGQAQKAPQGSSSDGRAFISADPEPWHEAVDGAALLEEVSRLIERFVILPLSAPGTVALWIAHTYVFQAFDATPRLCIRSPVKRCGKTTLMRVLARLVWRPQFSSGISSAALFRTVEKYQPTLLIDEMDAAKDNEELRGVLNSGHTRGGAIVRCVGDNYEPQKFSTWCPTALAYIKQLWSTVEDRAIRIPMRRQMNTERRERLRTKDLEPSAAFLRRKMARWAEDHFEVLAEAHPVIPGELDDRAADNWEPLLAIADAMGGPWPGRARTAAVCLSNDRDEMEEDYGLLLLDDLFDLVETGALQMDAGLSAEDTCSQLYLMSDRPWSRWGRLPEGLMPVHLAKILRPFGLKSVQRRHGVSVVRRYELEPLRDAFRRYLGKDLSRPATPAADSREPVPSSVPGGTYSKPGGNGTWGGRSEF
jgi:hypothetical protein